jgi:hypothetical protein
MVITGTADLYHFQEKKSQRSPLKSHFKNINRMCIINVQYIFLTGVNYAFTELASF